MIIEPTYQVVIEVIENNFVISLLDEPTEKEHKQICGLAYNKGIGITENSNGIYKGNFAKFFYLQSQIVYALQSIFLNKTVLCIVNGEPIEQLAAIKDESKIAVLKASLAEAQAEVEEAQAEVEELGNRLQEGKDFLMMASNPITVEEVFTAFGWDENGFD